MSVSNLKMKKWVSIVHLPLIVCLALVLTLLRNTMPYTPGIVSDFSWECLIGAVLSYFAAIVTIVNGGECPPRVLCLMLIMLFLSFPIRAGELQRSEYLIVMFFFMLMVVVICRDLFYLLYCSYRRIRIKTNQGL